MRRCKAQRNEIRQTRLPNEITASRNEMFQIEREMRRASRGA